MRKRKRAYNNSGNYAALEIIIIISSLFNGNRRRIYIQIEFLMRWISNFVGVFKADLLMKLILELLCGMRILKKCIMHSYCIFRMSKVT